MRFVIFSPEDLKDYGGIDIKQNAGTLITLKFHLTKRITGMNLLLLYEFLLSQQLVHRALGDQSSNLLRRRGLGLGNQCSAEHSGENISLRKNTCEKCLDNADLTCDSSSSPCCGTVCRTRHTGGSW